MRAGSIWQKRASVMKTENQFKKEVRIELKKKKEFAVGAKFLLLGGHY